MTILVFGKSGQVATCLQVVAKETGTDLICIGRPDCDIADAKLIERAFETIQPSLVVNAAAYTAVDKAEDDIETATKINAEAAGTIASAAASRSVPIIHLSTDYVFSGNKTTPYVETDETGPVGVYGKSKLAGEEMVRDKCPAHIIIRTAWVFSPFGANFLKTMLRLAGERDELGVVSDQFGNPTDAMDIASAILAVAQSFKQPDFDQFGTYHFCGPSRVSWADFAAMIFAESEQMGGPGCTVKPISTADYPTRASRPANSSLDCSKFLETFSFTRTPLQVSIRNTCEKLVHTSGTN